MRLLDLRDHATTHLPRFTDRFSGANVTIVSATIVGSTLTVETSGPHGLIVGNPVTLIDTAIRNPLTAVTQMGGLYRFTTQFDHDLTRSDEGSWPPHENINLAGFGDAGSNTSYGLVDVPNRRTFEVRTTNDLSNITGAYLIEVDRVDGPLGLFTVATVPDATTFTVTGDFVSAIVEPSLGSVRAASNIFTAVDGVRANEIYTSKPAGQFAMFIVGGDIVASKDRTTFADNIANRFGGADIRQHVFDTFDCLIFAPTSQQLTAAESLDICRHDLQSPLFRTFLGLQIDAGVRESSQNYRLTFLQHGLEAYMDAYLVYRYSFQAPFDLTDGDRFGDYTSAFRDANVNVTTGSQTATANADLDEEPLT